MLMVLKGYKIELTPEEQDYPHHHLHSSSANNVTGATHHVSMMSMGPTLSSAPLAGNSAPISTMASPTAGALAAPSSSLPMGVVGQNINPVMSGTPVGQGPVGNTFGLNVNPALTAPVGGNTVGSKPPQQMQQQHAISYVTTIRNRFANEPETYR